MGAKYIIRLDDACPSMHWEKWDRIFKLLDKYNIKPIIAVIPNNKDKSFAHAKPKNDFWESVKDWEGKGYDIAMHGYDHVYISKKSGIVPINKRSEFAGVDYEQQLSKIKKAWDIFLKNNIKPKIWVAPAHSFDKTTLKILKEYTDVTIVSDGLSKYPFNKLDFFWIPLQLWKPKEKNGGIWTICYHPNNMSEKQFKELEDFIKLKRTQCFPDIKALIDKYGKRSPNIFDFMFEHSFLIKMRIKRLIFSK